MVEGPALPSSSIEPWLDGGLDEAAVRDLEQAVCRDPDWARTLARAARLHVELERLLRLEAEESGGMTARPRAGASRRPSRRHPASVPWIAAAVAALLLVVVGWSWSPSRRPSDVVLADGRPVERGALIDARAAAIHLELGGYCRLTLDRGAAARVVGSSGAEAIVLERGAVSCDIIPHTGAFSVHCDLGEVRVTGTRFTASLEENPEAPMDRQLLVKVLLGAVILATPAGERLIQAGESATSRSPVKTAYKPTLPAVGAASVTRENCEQMVVTVEVPALADGGPTAHDPLYGNPKFWPQLTGKEYFLKETWPKAKLLVWAKPGISAGGRNEPSPTDPANWLLDGKQPTELVFDAETDVLLPASKQVYVVNFRDLKQIPRQVFRHLTVEAGANFRGGGDGVGRQIHGNVWVKRGAAMSAQGSTQWLGNHHTFVRNDNEAQLSPWSLEGNPTSHDLAKSNSRYMFSQYFAFAKANQASTEFFGQIITLDEFQVTNCPVIVAANSMLMPGRNAEPWIREGGTIALMDGAFFGTWSNNFGRTDLAVSGHLQAGMPDRPISRTATVTVAFKNHTDNRACPEKDKDITRRASLVLDSGSSLGSFSSDPKKAHLLITMSPSDRKTRVTVGADGLSVPAALKPEEIIKYGDWFDTLPRGITVYLAKNVSVDGVKFDQLWEGGGLLVQDANQPSSWKNVFYGAHLKKGAPLTTRIETIKREGSW